MPKKFSEEMLKKKAEDARRQWASLTPEERTALRKKQSEGAKRMWARRTEAERRMIGKRVAEGRAKAKKEKV